MRDKIPDSKRRMIESLLLEGCMTQKEIAETVGVSIHTVYIIHRDIEDAKVEQADVEKMKLKEPEKKKESNFRTPNRRSRYYVSHY